MRRLAVCLALVGALAVCVAQESGRSIAPVLATQAVPEDPDDPAIWVDPFDSSKGLVFGTVKAAAPAGGLAVFDLSGKLLHFLKGPDRPNNVDVEYRFPLAGRPTDIVVLTERLGRRLRVYAVLPDGSGVREVS